MTWNSLDVTIPRLNLVYSMIGQRKKEVARNQEYQIIDSVNSVQSSLNSQPCIWIFLSWILGKSTVHPPELICTFCFRLVNFLFQFLYQTILTFQFTFSYQYLTSIIVLQGLLVLLQYINRALYHLHISLRTQLFSNKITSGSFQMQKDPSRLAETIISLVWEILKCFMVKHFTVH